MRLLLLAAVLLAAGCLTIRTPPPAPGDLIGTPIVQKHEHTDAALHTAKANVRLVAWEPFIPQELGREGFAALRVVGDYGYLATDGAHAGFLIVNVSDPAKPKLVSQYSTPGGASQEAVPTPDGSYVFMNLQRQPSPADLAADPTRGDGFGIQIVDVRDKARPKFESFFPVEVRGTHVMYYHEIAGRKLLFYNGQPSGQPLPTGGVYTAPPGNVVHVAEFVEAGGAHTLRPVSEFRYVPGLAATTSEGCFPHDMWVEKHPKTGREVMYVAHWDCGAITVDVTDPENPVFLDAEADPAPSKKINIHYFRPDPTPRGDRVIAYSGPEIPQSPGEPGYLRAYDVTDPAQVKQVGTWRLPGEVENDMPFIFSPHNFDFNGNLLALAHYHAGVWVLDISQPESPRALGFYLPHGNETDPYKGPVWKKEPNFPIPYLPNVYEVKWRAGPDGKTYVLASERGTGLYVLEYTGRVP